ncbi:hypothetical protein [Psychrobacter aquaticus]|uniref:DUF4123 domain-containing protein n=1 Tax=Psychrobacter aquaticus CMS 56 TaxID=1354303 RepID=U4T215_9GAMM|nr:hypothetical protein [Psychrobacter aquaticus]ERL54917.1 hypothetical protein M917_2263 [Psychrobacter aquaticus CMS 56]
MLLPQVEYLDDIQATKQYQKQLEAVYQRISDNHYQQLTVLIDLNTYGTEIFNVLDCGVDLPFERIKRIHHTFNDDLALVDIQLGDSTGQRILEQLLALALYENINDIAGNPHSRSICLWLFNHRITETIKHSLYLIGQAYGLGTNKRRYLRYWDPRVIQLLDYLWTAPQKLQIYQLGLSHIYYVDWNNKMKVLTLPIPNKVYPSNIEAALEQLRPLPFRFNQQQWQLLEQTEWINMIFRQLKEQIVINAQSYEIVMSQALLIAKRKMTQQQAVNNIIEGLEQPRSQGVTG